MNIYTAKDAGTVAALQARIKELELECAGMGKLLQSGVVVKTDEYLALRKVVDAARRFCEQPSRTLRLVTLAKRIVELDGDKKPSNTCECGHQKSAHIYEEGACRPGFKCEQQCYHFTAKQ